MANISKIQIESGVYDLKDATANRHFNTRSDMLSSSLLSIGDLVVTLGANSVNDGKGNTYFIRTKASGESANNITTFETSNNLIAEIINDELTTNLYNTINKKLTLCKDAYFYQFDMKGTNFGLSYEKITNNPNPFSIQGICCNPVNGEIYANDGTAIFKLKKGEPSVKEVLYTINLGHGGDCCIFNNFMYVADYDYYNIHKVNLSNGNDTIYNISIPSITNSNTSGTPRIGGICINENGEVLIAVNDEYTDHTQIAQNSTLRIYNYNETTHALTKIFETANTLAYIQGMTIDNENMYVVGNRPFSSNYTGSDLFVINKFTYDLIDTLTEYTDLEFEGLDYCSLNGVEGLLTSLNKYNETSHFGIYAFYGNCTKLYTEVDGAINKIITESRGGEMNVRIQINSNLTANETYTYNNILKINSPKFGGAVPITGWGKGQSRTHNCLFEYMPGTDQLKVYPADNLTIFICYFSFCIF